MPVSRRHVLRLFGSLAAVLGSAGCAASEWLAEAHTPTGEPLPLGTGTPTGGGEPVEGAPAVSSTAAESVAVSAAVRAPSYSDPEWQRLGELWRGFEALEDRDHEFEWYVALREQLLGQHRSVLSDLVTAGRLDALITDEMQVAFSETTRAVWGADCDLTCDPFEPSVKYQTEGRTDLLRHTRALLAGVPLEGSSDPLAEAKVAIARGLAYLMLTEPQQKALGEYVKHRSAGAWPSLSELDLYVSGQCLEAARVLCELLAAREREG